MCEGFPNYPEGQKRAGKTKSLKRVQVNYFMFVFLNQFQFSFTFLTLQVTFSILSIVPPKVLKENKFERKMVDFFKRSCGVMMGNFLYLNL
jgi:hypothetical protein